MRQVESPPENPPTLENVADQLLTHGFERFSNEDYAERMDVEEIFVKTDGDNRPFAKIFVMGIQLIGLLDSGAQRTVLGVGCKKLLSDLRLKIYPSTVSLKTASGTPIEVEGYEHLPVTFNNENRIIAALVAPKLKRRLILGYDDFWTAFRIEPTVQVNRQLREGESLNTESELGELNIDEEEGGGETKLTNDQKAQLEQIKNSFKIAIEGDILDVTPLISHVIEFKEEFERSEPIRINPYPTSPEIQKKVNRELDQMLNQQVIERSKSDWSLSTVPVIKPTGEVRLCLDARRLNDRTRRDAYPLPHQDRILSRLGASRFMSTIDLTKAFLQIPLEPVRVRENIRLSQCWGEDYSSSPDCPSALSIARPLFLG